MDHLSTIAQVLTSTELTILDRIQIVEEEIARTKQQYPDKATLLDNAFMACQTPIIPPLPQLLNLYRVHVQQLLDMIAQGNDVDKPTLPEISVMTCAIADKAPPTTELMLLVLSDPATVRAYGLDPSSAPAHVSNHLWPTLREACRKAFISKFGRTRSEILAEKIGDQQ